jgi:hypothetical protein
VLLQPHHPPEEDDGDAAEHQKVQGLQLGTEQAVKIGVDVRRGDESNQLHRQVHDPPFP